MKLFVASGVALASGNDCGTCWTLDASNTCVPQTGKVTTTCGSNSIQVQIDPCLFEGTHNHAGLDFEICSAYYFCQTYELDKIHLKMHLSVPVAWTTQK